MRLKKHYSAREVAALTGVSANQMRWWDEHRLLTPVVPSHPTEAGGYTERRYSPIEVYELMAIAELDRRGFSARAIRQVIDALRVRFGIGLYDAVWGNSVALLTDETDIYARTPQGEFFNLLRDPNQPLLALVVEDDLQELTDRPRRRARARRRSAAR
jgi:DNA-binding transcriptional MerR regulator